MGTGSVLLKGHRHRPLGITIQRSIKVTLGDANQLEVQRSHPKLWRGVPEPSAS